MHPRGIRGSVVTVACKALVRAVLPARVYLHLAGLRWRWHSPRPYPTPVTPWPWLSRIIAFGRAHQCPICGSYVRAYLDYGRPALESRTRCPVCASLARLYLQERTDFFDGWPKSLLHLGPEPELRRRIARVAGIRYMAADLSSPLAMVRMDLLRAPYRQVGWVDGVLLDKRHSQGHLWQPTPRNLLTILYCQRRAAVNNGWDRRLRGVVRTRALELAQFSRWNGNHWMSLAAAAQLFALGSPGSGLRECLKSTIACVRDMPARCFRRAHWPRVVH